MKPTVKLRDLTDSLVLPPEWGAWLDQETGQVIKIDPDTRQAAEKASADETFPADVVRSEEMWAAARAIVAGDPRYLAVPDAFDFHEYRHMERFVARVADPRSADQLWRAIKSKGAFRHFKDAAHRLGLIEDWYRFRDDAAREHMLEWADANGIVVDQAL